MLSVIICSYNETLLSSLKHNIADTIGIPYEIISIDNSKGTYGICRAYNEGAAAAKYEYLCFMHEDISFETVNWGEKVLEHLSDPKIGLIGVAGGGTKSLVPSSWPPFIYEPEICYIQHYKFEKKAAHKILKTASPESGDVLKPVVCLDGMWLCTSKAVFTKYRFDEKTFTGFHGYDMDFSLQVYEHYRVGVVFDILLHHYSEGSHNRDWLNNCILLSKKWKQFLPLTVNELSQSELIRQHWTVMNIFIGYLKSNGYGIRGALQLLIRFSFGRMFQLKYFLYSLKTLFSIHAVHLFHIKA